MIWIKDTTYSTKFINLMKECHSKRKALKKYAGDADDWVNGEIKSWESLKTTSYMDAALCTAYILLAMLFRVQRTPWDEVLNTKKYRWDQTTGWMVRSSLEKAWKLQVGWMDAALCTAYILAMLFRVHPEMHQKWCSNASDADNWVNGEMKSGESLKTTSWMQRYAPLTY